MRSIITLLLTALFATRATTSPISAPVIDTVQIKPIVATVQTTPVGDTAQATPIKVSNISTTAPTLPKGYVLATDAEFTGSSSGDFHYIGDAEYVAIPNVIKGIRVTSYQGMFHYSGVKGVYSDNPNIESMAFMFKGTTSDTLTVTLNTANTTEMSQMFQDSNAKVLDLSAMDVSSVVHMSSMFDGAKATVIDLSGWNMRNVYYTNTMFADALATTGYARTKQDADKLNKSTDKPLGLTFTVK